MKIIVVSIIFCLGAIVARAQDRIFKAVILGSDDFEPISAVVIRDLQTGKQVVSDASGYFEIQTQSGHTLSFQLLGIESKQITLKPNQFSGKQYVMLKYDKRELDGVDVVGLSAYQLDSIERYHTYKTPLEIPKDKMKMDSVVQKGNAFGVIINAPLSTIMQNVSPKTKKRLRFQKNFQTWEEEKYIATKYTPQLVNTLTGLEQDSLAWFMNAYPMPYEMARLGTSRDIDIWIKGNFSDWKKNPNRVIKHVRIRK